ncbi:DUF262 domain-containing protein [Runella rosea]|uniref:DUF262 domain-containing protein n=1 Tax=Runella rosea TaxID=2259595 RepID=A0A344TNR1_9BACT|nr:DUF262 domain-containing protein [Runella rosea]AXE20282.1 DUF262 domain-containing protein [Runella rosea]
MDLISQLNELKRKVDFNTYDISVKELISMISENIIDIAPEYQRQFRWKEDRQSELIESIFLGIPIPSLFMATNNDGSWELIDGVQRLSSIIHFAGSDDARSKAGLLDKIRNKAIDNLKLSGLGKLSSFNNKLFTDLPKTVQLEFLLKPMKITTLSDKSDKNVRFDLFERLNTGGVVLTPQEIRSCVYRGRFNDFLKELSKTDDFLQTIKLTETQHSDGTREELVLRFFAFFENYEQFDHSVVDFLNSYMEKSSIKFDYETNRKIFSKTFSQLKNLPNGITKKRNTTPINLFEGVAVGAALALQVSETLILENANEWILGDLLLPHISGATNTKSKVIGRIEYCRDKFLGK